MCVNSKIIFLVNKSGYPVERDYQMYLLFFFLLLVKHTVADLMLQRYFVRGANKQKYLDLYSQTHYLHHSVLTLLIALFFVDFKFAVVLCVIDHIAHWHIDFAKTSIIKKFEITTQHKAYWALQSTDQSLHFATYYFLTLLLV